MTVQHENIWYEGFDNTKLYARFYPNPDTDLTILCLHGLTRNSLDFEGCIPALHRHGTLIIPDQRGRGMSSWTDPDTYTPVAYMRDMFKLLDSLGKKRVVVVGTSMGGIIAMLMTAAKPDAIQGVVLNDVGPEVTQEGLDKIKNYIGKNRYFSSWEGAEVFCKAQYGAGFPDYVNDDWKRFARRLYCESEPSDTDNGEKSTDKISLNYDPELDNVVKNSAESTVPKELWSLYAALDVKPLLIVRGENSDILSAECVDKMLSGRSHDISLTVDVRNRAHAPMLDEPDCIRSLDVFLKRVSEYSPAKKKAQTAEA